MDLSSVISRIVESLPKSSTAGRFDVKNPATGEIIAALPDAGYEGARNAIAVSVEAFKEWRHETAGKRSALLYRLHELMLRDREELAVLMTTEQGKPLAEARGEIDYTASYFKWFSQEAERIYGDIVPPPLPGRRVFVLKEPVGVCAAITPWNFPAAMLGRKAAAALAAGCTMISRPASETPLSAVAMAMLAREAGFPEGVFAVVTGEPAPISRAFMESREVRKISFTGSTEVGKLLIKGAADTLKRVTMELGGDAPFLVFEDADLDKAVDEGIFAKFRNSGQTCICVNRFLIHNEVFDSFVSKFITAVSALKLGNGAEQGTDLGPLINEKAVQKVRDLLQDAVSHGARILHGEIPDGKSLFVAPVVITDVSPEAMMSRTEVFGPVAVMHQFTDEKEAVEKANATSYGLAAYFQTREASRIFRVSDALQYGMIGINDARISLAQIPFGGVKESGFGREGGKYGIEEYLNIKYLCWKD